MIKLGEKVRNRITGFTGIATQRCERLNGTWTYWVESDATLGFKECWQGADLLDVIDAGTSAVVPQIYVVKR